MKKIVPLVSLHEVDNYIQNGVDAVLMGTYFGATRQLQVYSLEEMVEVNEKIPVIACYNRFYFEPEIDQLRHEIKVLYDSGIDYIISTDFAVSELVHELDLDMKVILDTDTTMTNVEDISVMGLSGIDEVVVGRELTLEERLYLGNNTKLPLGMHFFGYQLMSFSRRKHLSQYAKRHEIKMDPEAIHWLKESKRDEKYMTFEDSYGTHIFAPKVMSAIHAYQTIKEAGYRRIFFDVIGLNIEDVLFVVRNLDLFENPQELESMLIETSDFEIGHGLLYQETGKGK